MNMSSSWRTCCSAARQSPSPVLSHADLLDAVLDILAVEKSWDAARKAIRAHRFPCPAATPARRRSRPAIRKKTKEGAPNAHQQESPHEPAVRRGALSRRRNRPWRMQRAVVPGRARGYGRRRRPAGRRGTGRHPDELWPGRSAAVPAWQGQAGIGHAHRHGQSL